MTEKIAFGMVGGGAGSFIGPVHRTAAAMTGAYELKAGVFSSNAERSIEFAKTLGIDTERAYSDWETMLEQEMKREDPVRVISVVTPNDTHFPISRAFSKAGFHIICDKPLCNDLKNALTLREETKNRKNQVFCVTYNYSAYPMVKQARAMVKRGDIGEIRQVHLTYVQGNLAKYDPSENQSWRHDPNKGGASLVLGDIATHAFHLGEYVAQTEVEQVFAEVGAIVPNRIADDYVTCLLRFENGAKGTLWVTNAAAGAEHGLGFKIFGSKGGLEWHQEMPNALRFRKIDDFEQILTRRKDGKLYPEATESIQLEFGHAEGYHEAFSNLYRETADAVRKEKQNQPMDLPSGFPGIEAGIRGVAFVDACLKSKKINDWINLNTL